MQHTELLKTLQTLEEQIVDPKFRKSSAFLNQVLADDFMEIGSSGKIYNKAEVIAALQVAEDSSIILRDFKLIALADNVALLTFAAVNKNITSLRSSIWRLNAGKWQLLFHQGTKCDQSTR